MVLATRASRVVALLGAVTLLLAASCGSDGNDEAAAPDDPGATTEGSADESGSVGELDPTATFRFGWYQGVTKGLDPHAALTAFDSAWLSPMFATLVQLDERGELEPGLATEWAFTEDGSALELTIRDSVTFHDGAPLDADAVKANIDRARSLEGSPQVTTFAAVSSVDVTGPLSVRLNLSGPAASLPAQLAGLGGMMISPNSLTDPEISSTPVGAGMYKFVEWLDGDRLVAERFDGYWNPEDVGAARIEVLQITDVAARLNALVSAQIDATELPPAQFIEAEERGLVAEPFFPGSVSYLHLNRSRSELGDQAVRQAMSHAIDREGIAESLSQGYATPSPQLAPTSSPWHVEGLDDRYPYDPERARELLAEAGFPDGFTFTAIVGAGSPREAIAEVLQAQFAEVGITMELEIATINTLADKFFVQQNTDSLVSFSSYTDPRIWANSLFGETFSNPGGQTPESIQTAFAQSMQNGLSPEEEVASVQELLTAITEEAGAIIIMQNQALVATQPDVHGFTWGADGWPDYRGAGIIAD